MAPSKSEPMVSLKALPNGDMAIGAELDGVFVPFAQLDAIYVQALIQAGKSPEAQSASGGANGGEG
jgi:hypothetical protein